jgi:hypothetical protein
VSRQWVRHMQVVKKPRKRRLLRIVHHLSDACRVSEPPEELDFVHDETTDGSVRLLEALFSSHGTRRCIKSDNGPELIARHLGFAPQTGGAGCMTTNILTFKLVSLSRA